MKYPLISYQPLWMGRELLGSYDTNLSLHLNFFYFVGDFVPGLQRIIYLISNVN